MKSKYNSKTKTHNLYKILFLFVVFLGIGYAFLEANLNINGDVTVEAPELNVYVQSTSVTSGSTTGTPTIIGTDKKEVDFTTALTSDVNSFFETTTTLTNKGTEDVYFLGIDVKVYDSNNNEVTLTTPYEYALTKSDGTALEIGKKVEVGSTDVYKIRFNYQAGTDMSTVTTYPSYTFKITYNYSLWYAPLEVCQNNDNITTLSNVICSENGNITPSSNTICKRAINLHQEVCRGYCFDDGYHHGGETMTYGQCGTSGTLTSGDAFTCDVNGDGVYDELLERFYYVSDYYDTAQKDFDTTTATLAYYSVVSGGIACNVDDFNYYSSDENWHGPVTIKEQLPTIAQWPNVSLKNSSRAILGEDASIHDSPTTAGGTLPTDFSYLGYAARLLTAKEVMAGCNLTQVDSGNLSNCYYLLENTSYAKSGLSYSLWTETPKPSDDKSIITLHPKGFGVSSQYANFSRGVRPVIEIPKSKIIY